MRHVFSSWPYYSHHASFSVILCISNDDNNEASSSAPTTDAQNIHLRPPSPPHHHHHSGRSSCLITPFWLILFFFPPLIRQTILQQIGSSLLPISIFFSLSAEHVTSFWKSILTICFELWENNCSVYWFLLNSTMLPRCLGLQQIYKLAGKYVTDGEALRNYYVGPYLFLFLAKL